MQLIVLRAGDTEATVAPSVGANCVAFSVAGRALIEGPSSAEALAARPNGYGCPILFPFPGQLESGRLELLGRHVDLVANSPSGRHGHGFASGRPWRTIERGEDFCTCRLAGGGGGEYPWRFSVTARWRVTPDTLSVGLVVENLDQTDMPFGIGLHPYLIVEPGAQIAVPSTKAWPHDGGIPLGPAKAAAGPWRWEDLPVGGSILLAGLPSGDVEAQVGRTHVRWPGDRFGEVVVYRPPERLSVCVEPWSSVSNAAAQIEPGEPGGLIRLPAGETWRAWMELAPAL